MDRSDITLSFVSKLIVVSGVPFVIDFHAILNVETGAGLSKI